MQNSERIDLRSRLERYGSALQQWIKEDWPKHSPSDIRIGLWGTKGSGKTTFLAMLYEALALSDEWDVCAADKDARAFIKQHLRDLNNEYKNGLFPPPTPPTVPELKIFSYILTPRSPKKFSARVVLNFVDAPGEFYEEIHRGAAVRVVGNGQSTQTSIDDAHTMDIVSYLMSCDGIIFLLDPERSEEDGEAYSTLLEDLFWEFQDRSHHPSAVSKRLQQYTAFCVTKVDKEALWRHTQKPAELARQVMGKRMFEKLNKNYCYVDKDPAKNRYEFFAVSSIGRYRNENGEWQEAIVYPDTQTAPPDTPPSHSSNQTDRPSWDTDFPELTNQRFNPPSLDDLLSANSSSASNPPVQNAPTIKRGVDCRPFNVITPITWLIKGIQTNPPTRPPLG